MSLEVTTEARDGVTLVTLGGELDIYTVAGFRQDLEEVDPAARPLVIDLTDVTLLDSSGLGALVSLLNRARTGDGSIRAAIEPDSKMADNWELTTSDGSITLTLPSVFHAELDAETSDGAVRADRTVFNDERGEGSGEDERRERRRTLRTKLGDGGKMFRIRTGDGTIRIER